MLGGGAAYKAAHSLRKEIIETAARFLNIYPDALDIKHDAEKGQGVVILPLNSREANDTQGDCHPLLE